MRGLDRRLDLVFVRDVHGEGCSLAAWCADLGDQLVQLRLIAGRDRYGYALARQSERAGMTDALRRSCDQRDSCG